MVINSIVPKQHKFHQGKLDSLLSLFNIYQGIQLAPEEKAKATFIVVEDDKRGVYGGAILFQQRTFTSRQVSSHDVYEARIEKLIASVQSKKKVPWTVRLCLCIDNDASFSKFEREALFQRFFKTLYAFFVTFAEKERIKFINVTLSLVDAQRVFVYGNWPSLLEVKLADYADGFFHGILPLSETFGKPNLDASHPVKGEE